MGAISTLQALRSRVAILLAAVFAFAVIALTLPVALAVAADGSGSAGMSIGPAPTLAPSTGLSPQVIRPANTDNGVCATPPGEACYVDWFMSRGIAKVQFYFSDGEVKTGYKTCLSSTCSFRAIGYPPVGVDALGAYISGPNITVIATGPWFGP